LKDKTRMPALFEDFVRNFYRSEHKAHGFEVMRRHIDWLATEMTDADAKYLPIMKTDICLESPNRKIIIDTKFHEKTFDSQFETGTQKIKANDLYQLFSYLTNERSNVSGTTSLEGILLYPTIEPGVDKELSYILNGGRVRVATVDLSSNWKKIHERLLYLVQ
jgi:5-methylcytosine-specific restriction enzyme subunit McrC